MAKTIQELYSEKRKSEQQNNGSRTVKDIFWEKNGGDVADEITSRVNTWMQNSRNFNANFQNRYENGNDSYRSDSSDWLSKVTTQKNNFDKEASNIKSMLDAYKDYLNPEWSNSIKTALDQSSARQSEIIKYSSEDNAYWSQWDSADAYKQYVDYKKEYDKTTVAKNAADFEEYSKKGASIENPTMSEAEGFLIIGNKHIGGKDVGNEVTYSRDNWEEIAQIEAEGQGDVVGRSIYHYMKEDEVDIYNYYLAKYGKERADEYIVSIEDYLNQRKGGQIADNVKDAPALQFMFGAAAGLDQSLSGLRNLFADENSAKPSAWQYASSEIREDLAETGAKTPKWMGGNSVGQMAYDAITTSANMLPSILVSTLTGNPMLGAITLGASASGNAYADMLNHGYDKGQARAYSVLVGASEAFLQNAIGGITALGAGKFGAKGLTELALKKIDNAFARVAIQLGGTMLSEGFEESVQEVLDPWFKSIVFGTDFEAPSAGDVLYSGLLGAITGLAFEGAGIVSTEVNTYVTGRNIVKSEADVKRLAEIGTMFSPETTAGQIASKINDKTGAYTIGRLFNEVGATLSEQNISDISSALVERGFDEKSAQTLARAFDADVEGLSFTDKEKLALEKNDVLSGVIREKLIGENSTVYQRTEGYNTVLYNLAKEKSGNKSNTAAVSDTYEEAEQVKPYSGMNVFEVEKRIKAAMTDSASTEATGAHETATANKYSSVNENSVQGKYESNNDGVTTLKSTGETVEIKDIASIKDGEVRLNLANGETVSANDVNFSSPKDAVLYEAVSDMGVNPAAAYAIVKGYDAEYGTSIQNYILGIEEAYMYGKVGYPVSKINSKGFFNDLTEAQKRLGYDLGASDANAVYTAQQKAINDAKVKSAEINKNNGEKKSGRVIYEIDKATNNSMSERQRASAKALEYVASALGVDIHLFQSLTDENGKHIGANGWFDPSDNSIHIDISAGQNGEGVMLFTAAHELTHFIKAWSPAKFKTFADFLVSQYGEKGVDVNALIQNQIDKAKRNGRSIDLDTAYEEMIADSCQKMLTDSNAIKKLAKLKAQDKSLWTKIKKYVSEIIARIRKAYEGMTPYSEEARIVSEQMLDVAEKLNTLFNDALIDAGETYSEVRNAVGEDAVISVNEDGEFLMAKSSDGTRLFNDRTWTDGGRDVLKASLEREGFSEEDVNAALTIMDAKHDLVKQLGKEFSAQDKVNKATITTDVKNGKSVLTALVSNGEYPVNIDLMMVCKKRVAYQRVINRLCETGLIENATLDSLAIAEINKILGKNGFETACLGCFVESRRIRIQEWAETICSEWNGLVDKKVGKGKAESFGFSKEKSEFLNDLSDDYVNKLSDELESAGEINYGRTTVVKKMEKLLDTIPSMRKHLSVADLITPSGRANLKSVSMELNSLVACRYGSNTPKIVQDFNPYNSELALYDKYSKDYSSLREYLYAIGGARMQSFSDFIVENWFDYCQIVADLASRKLPMHTYTKEISLAKLFGLTGIKINMSLIPDIDRSLPREYAGLTKNANGEYELIFADKDRNKATGGKSYMQSINFADAVALQNDPRYSSNIGTIAVGISDNHILKMLDDPRIRMIIPYHSSGMNPIFAKLVGTDYYTDYTNYQNTGVKHLVDEKGNIRDIKLSKTQIQNLTKYEFNEVLQRTGDAKAAAREYLDWCADASQHSIVINGTTYNAVLEPKFDGFSYHENYYKLLEDFNTYDSVTGNPAPQGDVTQTYPDDFEDILRSELSNMSKYRSKTDPKFEGAMSEIESYLKKHTKSDTLAYAKENGIKLSKKDEKITAKDKQKEENLKKLYSLRDVDPVQPTSDKWNRTATTAEAKERYPKLWDISAEESDSRNPTQIAATVGTYRRIYDYLKSEGFNGTILDASSGLGYGTKAGIEEYGFDVEDIEPYPDSKYHPKYTDYSSLDKQYDAIISSFVLNVLPQDQRDALVVKMGELLKEGGKMFVNTRSNDVNSLAKNGKNIQLGDMEFIETSRGSYQKGFKKQELVAYLQDALGDGFTFEPTTLQSPVAAIVTKNKTVKYSDRDKAPVFYSQMGKVIDGIKSEKVGANGVVPYLKGKGVKDEEIKWSGIEAFLEGKKSVKKSELQEFVAGSMLQIDEQMSGTSVFVADDGNTYNSQTEFKDAAYAVADKNGIDRDRVKFIIDTNNDMDAYAYVGHPNNTILTAAVEESEGIAPRWDKYKLDGGKNYREIVFTIPDSSYSNQMMKTHWGDEAEGVLAHARVQDFDVNGKKMLFIEEIQSDWHNEGRSKGYESDGDSSEIVVCTIREYDSKDGDIIQVIYNKDDGSISASNGDDLGVYYADSIDTATKYAKQMFGSFDTYKERGSVTDAPFKDTYQEYVIKRLLRMAAENGYDSIGWTTAEMQEERWSSDYAEGYRIEYDQDIPKFLNKYGKKWGGKVEKTQIDTGTSSEFDREMATKGMIDIEPNLTDVWSFTIPESMKESVLYEGQPMYSDRDVESADNRTILSNALKSAAMNQKEKQILIEYKKNIDKIGIEERDLAKINAKIKELSFSKGKRDTKQLAELKDSAIKIRNRINIYDKKLLSLEATKHLKDVVKREREIAYKSAIEKGNAQINELRQKKAEAISNLRQKFKDQNAKKKERMDTTAMRHKVIDVVNDLNQYLLRGTKEKHVPIGLQKPVAELLSIINMDTQNADERVAEYDKRIAAETDEITKEALVKSRDRIKEQGENLAEKIASLKSAYADIVNSDDPIIANSHDEVIYSIIDKVSKNIGNTPIRKMSLEQLESLYKMVTAVRKSITTANKAFKARNKENIAILGNNTMEEVLKAGGKHDYSLKSLESAKNFAWNMLKPTTAMKIIGSSTLKELFYNVRAGEDTWAVDVDDAKQYFQTESKKYGYDSWDFDSKKTFTAKNGKPFSLTLEQIMSLYAYSKRPQADKHLEMGGIVFDKDIEVKMKTRSGISLTYNPNTADAYNIAPETLGEIIGSLTKEQKQFVDEMQKYLSVDMGAKGNEVSRALYDINLFNEKNYFPLKSAPEYMAKAREQQQGDIKIKNSGFSKETVPKASNPIVLSNFMDVWSGHVNDMSMYHAFVLPLEDFYRVYNYKTPIHDEYGTESVQMALRNAYGSSCTAYIEQFLKDINGGARADKTTGFINKAMSLMKKGSVFASASVVIQQPSAIARAFAYINPKYFATNPLSKNHKAEWEEVKKYAPVAIIKEMGRFDTNVGRQTADWIKSRTYETKSEKANALVTDSAYRDDVLSAPAAMADELSWCYIWKAVKNEIKSTTDLKEGSKEFLEASGKRFTEVIVNTQVYDSVLTRSGMMRSKDTGMKMATAFMAEPMTSLNMIVEGIVSAKRGDNSIAKASVGAVSASVILNSILVSLVYAARDDDEDETYLEKYIGSMTSEVIDGLNPVTYIPFIKDIWSIAQGYDVERLDMSVASDLWKSIKGLFSDSKTPLQKVESFAGTVAALFGLPVKNILRDARGLFNVVRTATSGNRTTAYGIGKSVKSALIESIPLGNKFMDTDSKSEELYKAVISGDDKRIERAKAQYKDEDAVNTALRKELRNQDSRISEAANARIDGNISEYARITREIVAEGIFSQDEVVKAINAEISAIKSASASEETGVTEVTEETEETGYTSIYSYSDINSAISNGDIDLALSIIDDLEASGKNKSSIKASVTSYLKPLYKAAYEAKNKDEMKRIREMMYDLGIYGRKSEIIETAKGWLKD